MTAPNEFPAKVISYAWPTFPGGSTVSKTDGVDIKDGKIYVLKGEHGTIYDPTTTWQVLRSDLDMSGLSFTNFGPSFEAPKAGTDTTVSYTSLEFHDDDLYIAYGSGYYNYLKYLHNGTWSDDEIIMSGSLGSGSALKKLRFDSFDNIHFFTSIDLNTFWRYRKNGVWQDRINLNSSTHYTSSLSVPGVSYDSDLDQVQILNALLNDEGTWGHHKGEILRIDGLGNKYRDLIEDDWKPYKDGVIGSVYRSRGVEAVFFQKLPVQEQWSGTKRYFNSRKIGDSWDYNNIEELSDWGDWVVDEHRIELLYGVDTVVTMEGDPVLIAVYGIVNNVTGTTEYGIELRKKVGSVWKRAWIQTPDNNSNYTITDKRVIETSNALYVVLIGGNRFNSILYVIELPRQYTLAMKLTVSQKKFSELYNTLFITGHADLLQSLLLRRYDYVSPDLAGILSLERHGHAQLLSRFTLWRQWWKELPSSLWVGLMYNNLPQKLYIGKGQITTLEARVNVYPIGKRIVEKLLNRLTTPYDKSIDSMNATFLKMDGRQIAELEISIKNKIIQSYVDTAEDVNLDRIGALFGLERLPGEDDDEFRARIKSAVPSLVGGGTLAEIKRATTIVTGSADPRVIENFPAHIAVLARNHPDEFSISTLHSMTDTARAAGVKLDYVGTEFDETHTVTAGMIMETSDGLGGTLVVRKSNTKDLSGSAELLHYKNFSQTLVVTTP